MKSSANMLTGRLVLLRNLGNWQFAATTLITYPTAGSYLYRVQAADLDIARVPWKKVYLPIVLK